MVNGFNLGRYWNVGPQRTLYVPAPVLKRGENEASNIIVSLRVNGCTCKGDKNEFASLDI